MSMRNKMEFIIKNCTEDCPFYDNEFMSCNLDFHQKISYMKVPDTCPLRKEIVTFKVKDHD